jgi:hypothetical protein
MREAARPLLAARAAARSCDSDAGKDIWAVRRGGRMGLAAPRLPLPPWVALVMRPAGAAFFRSARRSLQRVIRWAPAFACRRPWIVLASAARIGFRSPREPGPC